MVDVPVLDRPRPNTLPLNLHLCVMGGSTERRNWYDILSLSMLGGKIGDDRTCNGGGGVESDLDSWSDVLLGMLFRLPADFGWIGISMSYSLDGV